MDSIGILGSGKMARDIGLYFLQRGHQVLWFAGSAESLSHVENFVQKQVRRYSRSGVIKGQPAFHLLSDAAKIRKIDCIIECRAEDVEKKQSTIAAFNHLLLKNGPFLFTASSSILPSILHPACMGCHFFYPVSITACIELILPAAADSDSKKNATNWLRINGLSVIKQTEKNAFSVNRLLLPVQAESLRFIKQGIDPKAINEISQSVLLPSGQLSIMDSIGFDVIAPAVDAYVKRMPESSQKDYQEFHQSLKLLIAMGKRGAKNKDGFLCGQPLPWLSDNPVPDVERKSLLKKRMLSLFILTCRKFISRKEISIDDLDLALKNIFMADMSFDQAVNSIRDSEIQEVLLQGQIESGRSYFSS